jgi:hypothetical protein
MDRAQQPAKRDVVVQELQALPGVRGGRRIDQRQQNSRHDLQPEQDGRAAAEDVPPARRVGRNRVLGRLDRRLPQSQAEFQPVVDLDRAFFDRALFDSAFFAPILL